MSVFRGHVNEVYTLLGIYAAWRGNSARKCYSTPRKSQKRGALINICILFYFSMIASCPVPSHSFSFIRYLAKRAHYYAARYAIILSCHFHCPMSKYFSGTHFSNILGLCSSHKAERPSFKPIKNQQVHKF